MKKCPLCNAEIADDLQNCGNHNTVTISMSDNPVADALAAAKMQLMNRQQALRNAKDVLAGLQARLATTSKIVAAAQTAVQLAQANVDTLQKFIGGES